MKMEMAMAMAMAMGIGIEMGIEMGLGFSSIILENVNMFAYCRQAREINIMVTRVRASLLLR